MKDAKIIGIPLPLYLAIGVLLTVAMYVGALPGDFTGAFAIAVYWGSLFMWLGAKIPIVNTYMGGQILLKVWIFPGNNCKNCKNAYGRRFSEFVYRSTDHRFHPYYG